jgi:endogenous inhibitor of DNA gyrase (YacG/DUF329 family)
MNCKTCKYDDSANVRCNTCGEGYMYYEPSPNYPEPSNRVKVIDIEKNIPHKVSEVICIGCAKRWLAVRPTGTLLKDISCPACGKGGVIETGEIMEVK